MSDVDAVKNFAKSSGAHLVGVASSDRFKEAPKGHRPEDLLSGAESVVVMALCIPLSIVRSIPSTYYSSCYRLLNEQLRGLAYKVAAFIEECGSEAVPTEPAGTDFTRYVEILQEKPEPKVRMLDDFSHRHAAVMAGLAEMSAAAYVVVPRLGPRIRFVSVITTAPLKPDVSLKQDMSWGSICRPETCGLVCVKACPPGALPGDGTVDHFKCRRYRDPETYTLEYFKEIVELKEKGVSPLKRISVLSRTHSPPSVQTCGRCVKACPIGITI